MRVRKLSEAMLLVTHCLGGGTERHVRDIATLLQSEGISVFICRRRSQDAKLLIVGELETIEVDPDLESFTAALRGLRIAHIHIHHLARFGDHAPDFFQAVCLKIGIQYDVTLHDYMAVCPRISLLDRSLTYCGEPGLNVCEACIRTSGSPFGHPNVREWRERFGRLLVGARRIFVPSKDVQSRIVRFMPEVRPIVRPHPDTRAYQLSAPTDNPRRSGAKRIGVIGAIGPHKGSHLLCEVARFAQCEGLRLRFNVIGFTDKDSELRSLDNVEISWSLRGD